MGFQFSKLAYKEKFKKSACKSKQIPGGKLSHLAWMKFDFPV